MTSILHQNMSVKYDFPTEFPKSDHVVTLNSKYKKRQSKDSGYQKNAGSCCATFKVENFSVTSTPPIRSHGTVHTPHCQPEVSKIEDPLSPLWVICTPQRYRVYGSINLFFDAMGKSPRAPIGYYLIIK